jgi:NAD(P)-dependent dehydrogenase (short-subunit alcohol dehydrogenase family)
MAKEVLVIGGRSGIGKQVVADLLEDGYHVTAASREISEDDFEGEVSVQKFDVTGSDELDLPDELHGLVYCPGTIKLKPFDRIGLDQIQEEMEINYLGAVKVLHQAIKALKKGKGSAVFFSTVAVQTGMPFHSSISAAKGAVEGMVRSLAAEYAPKVRFNAIAPSLTDTPLAESMLNSDKKRESNASRHPLNSIGDVKDISEGVRYLISDRSRWVTGQILKIDGGMSSLRSL